MDLQPLTIGVKPVPYDGLLVIRRIVLNQNRALASIAPGQSLQKSKVGHGVKDRVLAIVKAGLPQFYGPENLDALALAGNRDLGRMSHSAPSSMQRGVLPEAGLIGEDQGAVFLLGFFFRFG